MPDKSQVRLRVTSVCEDQTMRQHISAERYMLRGRLYLRYAEPEQEMGRTTTTVRIEEGEIRILRHGDIRSEQTFVQGARRGGFYETAQGRLTLETDTKKTELSIADGLGTVRWSYDLYVADELAGTYRLRLDIEQE